MKLMKRIVRVGDELTRKKVHVLRVPSRSVGVLPFNLKYLPHESDG
jgi:hypothetical protein